MEDQIELVLALQGPAYIGEQHDATLEGIIQFRGEQAGIAFDRYQMDELAAAEMIDLDPLPMAS
ncbi:MAG: hypothetical protein ACQEXG_06090 [Pseudomonadota bacterium]